MIQDSITADLLSLVKPSPTVALTGQVADLKRQGKEIIGLGAGEPDFPVPEHIKAALVRAVTENRNTYTAPAGIIELREEIAKKLNRDYGITPDPKNNIMVGCGGKQLLMLAFYASLNPKDEVIIPAPYWVSYPDMVTLAQGTPVIVPCPSTFKITAEQLQRALTPKSRWLVLNSPSNPTGEVYTRDELQSILNVVAQHPRLHVISDDIYEHLVYDDHTFTPLVSLTDDQDLKDRILIANGFSKTFCMTGWRLGWACGSQELIKAMTMLASQSTTHPASLVQYAGVTALREPLTFLDGFKRSFVKRRNLVVEALNAMPGLTCRTPQGAFYVYPHCAAVIGKKTPSGHRIESDNDLATYLLEQAGVAVVPGVAFGLEPYLRISYATSDSLLEKAMSAMHKALCALS